jgi:AraC-like DNA-binding protein
VRHAILRQVLSTAPEADELLERHGLAAVRSEAGPSFVPVQVLREFFAEAAVLGRSATFGLDVARQAPVGTLGLLEFIAQAAPTVREAVWRVCRYADLSADPLTFLLDERDSHPWLTMFIAGELDCLGRHFNELVVGYFVLAMRRMCEVPFPLFEVRFAHAAPDCTEPLRELFGTTRLRFDCGHNDLVFYPETLALPIASSNPPLLAFLDQQAEGGLRELAKRRSLTGRVSGQIRDLIARGHGAGLDDVARELRVSRRTLQRQLELDGVSFQDLVATNRHQLALHYLDDEARPLAEIAERLGYSELRPFLRAFKRWTGQTPSQRRGVATS